MRQRLQWMLCLALLVCVVPPLAWLLLMSGGPSALYCGTVGAQGDLCQVHPSGRRLATNQHSDDVTKESWTDVIHAKYLMTPRVHCTDAQFLVIYVHTAPSNTQRRRLVRRTWGQRAMLRAVNATMIFLMGRVSDTVAMETVKKENDKHGDILQVDFIDSYYNLTYKAVAGLEWVGQHCRGARYLLKSDDDIVLDLVAIATYLVQRVQPVTGGNGIIACNVRRDRKVIRDPANKWYITKEEYSAATYDPFCQGSAYVISSDVVAKLPKVAAVTSFFKLDDVFITGILARKLGVRHVAIPHAFSTNVKDRRDPPPLMVVQEHDRTRFLEIWQSIVHRSTKSKRDPN